MVSLNFFRSCVSFDFKLVAAFSTVSTLKFFSSWLMSGFVRTFTFKFSIWFSSSSVSLISVFTAFLISETFKEKTDRIATLRNSSLACGFQLSSVWLIISSIAVPIWRTTTGSSKILVLTFTIPGPLTGSSSKVKSILTEAWSDDSKAQSMEAPEILETIEFDTKM